MRRGRGRASSTASSASSDLSFGLGDADDTPKCGLFANVPSDDEGSNGVIALPAAFVRQHSGGILPTGVTARGGSAEEACVMAQAVLSQLKKNREGGRGLRLLGPGADDKRSARSACWIFTAWTANRPRLVPGVDYICCQQERCPSNGRLHWQGYLELGSRMNAFGIMVLFLQAVTEPAWVEATHGGDATLAFLPQTKDVFFDTRRGPQFKAIAYTKKANQYTVPGTWMEEGTKHAEDVGGMWMSLQQDIESGMRQSDLNMKYFRLFAQFGRGIVQARMECLPPPADRDVKCYLFYGPTGSGKTRRVRKLFGDRHVDDIYAKVQGKWWDGYMLQPAVLFDDFYGANSPGGGAGGGMREASNGLPIDEMLRVMDRYPHQVEVKNGHRWLRNEFIFFTSNHHRDNWYPHASEALKQAFRRRLPDEHCIYIGYAKNDPRRRHDPAAAAVGPMDKFMTLPEPPQFATVADLPLVPREDDDLEGILRAEGLFEGSPAIRVLEAAA
jgi:hypothetical protein